MLDKQRKKEAEVFNQELSTDDLDAAAGGSFFDPDTEADENNCVKNRSRPIYGGGGFPNCAATVEDGSWCDDNDACVINAVQYTGRETCGKAWR